jgi:hypothetical protein
MAVPSGEGMLTIEVDQGDVRVEAISGRITEDFAVLYVTCGCKQVTANAWVDGPVESCVSVSSLTSDKSTNIWIKGGWQLEASASRYTVRIFATKIAEGSLVSIPFTEVTRG